jgi:hypothetical protein
MRRREFTETPDRNLESTSRGAKTHCTVCSKPNGKAKDKNWIKLRNQLGNSERKARGKIRNHKRSPRCADVNLLKHNEPVLFLFNERNLSNGYANSIRSLISRKFAGKAD